VESVFDIIAEPNRRAILSLLVSSQQSVREIERQLRMPQPTVSKHLRVLREAGFVESTVDPAPSLPAETGTTAGGGCLAGSVPPVLVRSRRCARTPPRPPGAIHTSEKEGKEKEMTNREGYTPGPARGAQVRKDGETWTLLLVRELRHPPAMVWQALTDPAHLSEWAPFDADRNLAAVGPVKLSTAGTPRPQVSETTVKRAEAPRLLEYSWGGSDLRWELEPLGSGTRLTLWHNIDRRFISLGAAGWHICFDVLDRLLTGTPIGRIVAGQAMKFGGWQRLNAEYARQFGVETPHWPPPAAPES
jgi:uncharacterized protein YndB with AHSA1/START domain